MARVELPELGVLLDRLGRGPLSPPTLRMLASLCSRLKAAGAEVEVEHGAELDRLQAVLPPLCQDSSIDLQLRLQLLEIIELRTLGWKSNKGS